MKLLLIAPAGNCLMPIKPELSGECYSLTGNLDSDIKIIENKNADLVIIPIEQSATYLDSHLLGGLELFVWLRIKGIETHVIITSFFSLQQIMQKEKLGFVLGSKGVSFQQIPSYQFGINYTALVDDKAKDDNLKSYLSAVFDIANFRHAYANVWGLKRLVEVHKKYDITFDDSKIKFSQIESSLNYQIANFIFGVDLNQQLSDSRIGNYIAGYTMNDGKNIKGVRKEIKELNVFRYKTPVTKILLIDDQAETGWECLLKSILPNNIDLEKLTISETETVDTLKKKFESNYIDNSFLMVILDLRLLKSEEHEGDYEKLLSVKLMKQMLSRPHNSKQNSFYYPYLKFLLFTASNQLHNMLSVINTNEHIPHRIFIKEGFDINQTKDQLYKNYLLLLQSIYHTASANYRNNPKRLESFILEEQNKIEHFQREIDEVRWQNEINQIYTNTLSNFTHIVLDTNIFYLDNPLIALSPDANIILLYPVYMEMLRILNDREQTYRKFCAEYFLELFKNKIGNTPFDSRDTDAIDEAFARGNSDIADNYFKKAVEYYTKDSNNKILFITNDTKGKAGNNKNQSPKDAVLEWKTINNIENITVATAFKCIIEIQDPSKEQILKWLSGNHAQNQTSNNNTLNKLGFQNFNFIKLSNDEKYILLRQKNIGQSMCVYIEGNELGKKIAELGVGLLDNYDLASKRPPYPKWIRIDDQEYLKISFNSVLKMLV